MTLFAPFVIETHKLSKTYKNVEEIKPLNLNECQKLIAHGGSRKMIG